MARAREPNARTPAPVPNPARTAFITDRLCPRCEYNLKGLSPGMLCPECGQLIVTPAGATAREDNLTSAPRGYLRMLAWALCTMAIAAIAGVILLVQRRPDRAGGLHVAGAVVALVWCAGVFLVTSPRPQAVVRAVTPRMQMRHARWLARLSQVGWLALPAGLAISAIIDQQAMLAAATAGQAFKRPDLSVLMTTGAWIGAGLGILGMMIVCYMLSEIADSAADSALSERLRMACLGLPIGVPLALGGLAFADRLGHLALLGMIGGVASMIGAVVSAGFLLLGLVQLAYMSFWAIRNNENWDELLERKDQRERDYDRQMVAKLDATPMAPQDSPVVFADDGSVNMPAADGQYAPLIIPSAEHVIPKPKHERPYELSEDPPAA